MVAASLNPFFHNVLHYSEFGFDCLNDLFSHCVFTLFRFGFGCVQSVLDWLQHRWLYFYFYMLSHYSIFGFTECTSVVELCLSGCNIVECFFSHISFTLFIFKCFFKYIFLYSSDLICV